MTSEIDPAKMQELALQTQIDKRKASIAFKTLAFRKAIQDFKKSSLENKKMRELDLQHQYGAIAQFVTEFKRKQQGKEKLYAQLAVLLNMAKESAGKANEICIPLVEASKQLTEHFERVKQFDLDSYIEAPTTQADDSASEKENEPRSPHVTILSANDTPISCSPAASSRSMQSGISEVVQAELQSSVSVSYEPSSFFESVPDDSFPNECVSDEDSSLTFRNETINESLEESKQAPKVPPINWKRTADVDTSLSSLMDKSQHTDLTESADGPVEWSKFWSKGKQYEVEVKRKSTSWKRLLCPCFS
mmetsp:Transcript_9475/g.18292  ORF Transcript_9475/g.18292 Transcript_9475/m.18292 type:complete len:305 (-) Transcript_9475:2061-2975(-)